MIKLKDIQLGKVYSNPQHKAFTEVNDVPTKGSNTVKGGVSSVSDNRLMEQGRAGDMFKDIQKGTGWSTADYVTNNPHVNLNETERLILLFKLAKNGMLADEFKLSGKEETLKQIPRSALMSIKDVKKKYGEIKSRYDEKLKKESVINESNPDVIGSLTGLSPSAVLSFISNNNIDADKLTKYIKKGKLKDRMNLVTAIVGNPGNTYQKMIIKQFGSKHKWDTT